MDKSGDLYRCIVSQLRRYVGGRGFDTWLDAIKPLRLSWRTIHTTHSRMYFELDEEVPSHGRGQPL